MNKYRTLNKFAWMPTKLDSGWIWLRNYVEIQQHQPKPKFNLLSFPEYIKYVNEWVTIHKIKE